MTNYAYLVKNKVINAIVADAEFIAQLPNSEDYKLMTRGGIGWTYDAAADVFIAPQPYASWTLDENYDWQPPTPQPPQPPITVWNERKLEWVLDEY